MSQWLSPGDLRNKLLEDICRQQKETQNTLLLIHKSLSVLNDQIMNMRRENEEYKDEVCSAITMLGIKSPSSSEYEDVIDHPAVGLTADNRKVSTSYRFPQTRVNHEGATDE